MNISKRMIVQLMLHCFLLGLIAVGLPGCASSSLGPLPFFLQRPDMPQIPAQTFSALDYGVKGDGKTVNTAAIDAALTAVSKAGGGRLIFPAGTYFTGPIVLRSSIDIHLDKGATLLFSDKPSDYPVVLTRWEGTECMNYSGLITGRNLHDIAITGEGTIDGGGKTWWPWKEKADANMKKLRELGETTDDPTQRVFGTEEGKLRPCLYEPIHCKRILLDGVTFSNSPFWTLHPTYCQEITATNLFVQGDGPNTDGFDPDSCKNILVKDCKFDTGDDCITLKSGRDRDGRRIGIPTENVIVLDCSFKRGHGTVVIGSEMSGGVRNVYARNLTADGTDAGVRIKTRQGRGGTVENILYENVTVKNIQKQAITIDMFYDVKNNPDVDQSGWDATPTFRNITVENFKCEDSAAAIVVQGLARNPMHGIVLRNVQIVNTEEGVTCTNAPNTRFDNVVVKNATTRPATRPSGIKQ